MSADVIRVVSPQGDLLISINPLNGSENGVIFYKRINDGKSVRIDLKSEDGFKVLLSLISSADVLLESLRPGVLDKFGFSPQLNTNKNPKIIHCYPIGYSQKSSKSDYGGHDINYITLTGGLSVTGSNDTPLVGWPLAADFNGAFYSLNAILGGKLATSGLKKEPTLIHH